MPTKKQVPGGCNCSQGCPLFGCALPGSAITVHYVGTTFSCAWVPSAIYGWISATVPAAGWDSGYLALPTTYPNWANGCKYVRFLFLCDNRTIGGFNAQFWLATDATGATRSAFCPFGVPGANGSNLAQSLVVCSPFSCNLNPNVYVPAAGGATLTQP